MNDLTSYEYVMNLLLSDLEYTTENPDISNVEDDIRYYCYDYSYYIVEMIRREEYENAASLRGALVLTLMNYGVKISDAHNIIKLAIEEHEG